MHSLYKYMPFRDGKFFDNLLIRAAMRKSLNDPFESSPSIDYLTSHMQYQGSHKSNDYQTIKEDVKKMMDGDKTISPYDDFGVISFSETYDNLLMWSHYSEDHTGFIIEINPNHRFFKSEQRKYKFWEKFHRVQYKKGRPQSVKKIPEELHNVYPFIVKSDEWIYEKEHRFIVDTTNADRCYVLKQYKDFLDQDHSKIQKEKPSANINHFQVVHQFKYTGKTLDGLHEVDYKNDNYFHWSIRHNKNVFHMFKIPPSAITGVILGGKMPKPNREIIKNKIRSTKGLQHIKITQADFSHEKFELKFRDYKKVIKNSTGKK